MKHFTNEEQEDLLDSTVKHPVLQSKLNQDLTNVQYKSTGKEKLEKPKVEKKEEENALNQSLRIEKLKYAVKTQNDKKNKNGPLKIDQGQ